VAEIHRDDAVGVDPERQVADLLSVLEVARRLATLAELSPLLALVEQSTRRLLDCERAILYLYDQRGDELASRVTGELSETRLPAGRGLLGDVFRRKAVVNTADPAGDPRLHPQIDQRLAAGARCILACPVLGTDETAVGVLLAVDARRDGFDEWDEVAARALAGQAGAAIQRHRLYNADRTYRFERDIDVARQIQQALLPHCPPTLEGYDIAGWYQPADETGGDFFDFPERGPGRLGVAIGDVSGHGVGPALVVASCRAFLRATLVQSDEPSRVITQVNQLLCHDQLEDRFVTAFFGMLGRDAHQLDYVSAGQGPILFYSHAQDRISELEIQGFPLGLSLDLSFGPPESVKFAPGDFLAVITDGFFEWFNGHGECFGIERMKVQIARDHDRPAAEIIRQLHSTVLDFADGSPQPDDLTAVVIKRLV
jgi:phosphoserine phosphatase